MSVNRLEQAIALFKQGDTEEARPILIEILTHDPQDEIAWMYLVKSLSTPAERIEALEHCLRINPYSNWALTELEKQRTEQVQHEPIELPPEEPEPEPIPLPELPPGIFGTGEIPEIEPPDPLQDSSPSGIQWTSPEAAPPALIPTPEETELEPELETEPEPDPAPAPKPKRKQIRTVSKPRRSPRFLLYGLVGFVVVAVVAIAGFLFFGRGLLRTSPEATVTAQVQATSAEISTPLASQEEVTTSTPEPLPSPTEEPNPTPRPTIKPPMAILTDRPVINPQNGAEVGLISEWRVDEVVSLAFSPDGRYLAAGTWEGSVWIWETATFLNASFGRGQERYRLTQPFGVNTVAFSPDGQTLAFGISTVDRPIRLLDLSDFPETGSVSELPIRTLEGHSDGVKSVAFAPDGRLFASASFDNTVRLWDLNSGDTLGVIEGYYMENMAFSPNGLILATASFDAGYTTFLWDALRMPEESETQDLELGTLDGGPGMAFTNDGSSLVSAEEQISVWNLPGAQDPAPPSKSRTLPGHTELVQSLAISPDGQLLASGARDRKIKLWVLDTGREIATLVGHGDRLRSLVFSPDGSLLATAADDGTIRIWAVVEP